MATKRKPRKVVSAESPDYVLPAGKALVMRTCAADMTSYKGVFRWPESGPVEAPDWKPTAVCGNGLHGLLWGEGCGEWLAIDDPTAKWLAVEIDPTTAINLDGKVKFQRGVVVFVGDRNSAPQWLSEHGGAGRAIVSGTATAGDIGTATAGDRGTATAGYSGTATAGDSGTATAGDRGTATAGDRGTAKTGEIGIIVCRWYDDSKERYRLTVGYVGEDGIEPNTFYRCDERGKLVKA